MKTKDVAVSSLGVAFRIIVTIAVVFLVYKGAVLAYNYGYRIFAEPAMAAEGTGEIVTVAIPEGKDVKEVGNILKAKGLIRDPQLFYYQYITSKYAEDEIVPGAYELSTEMVAEDILDVITKKPEVSSDEDWG